MGFYTDTLKMFAGQFLSLLVIAYIGISVALFIVECIKSKKQHRKFKTGIKVMFIIAVTIAAILAILTIIFMIIFFTGMYVYIFR